MKRHLFTLMLFLFGINFSFSQDYQIREAVDLFKTQQIRSGEWKNTLSETDIKGSPYLNNEFVNGTIFTTTKLKYVDVPLRYNIFNDELEFKNDNNQIRALATPEIVETVEFGDYKMVYIPYSNVKKIRNGFFLIEEKGNASLYSRLEVIFKKAEDPGAYVDARPPEFIKKPDSYYIRVGTAEAKKVGKKNDLPEIFPDHQNEISAFIKKNKIKTNRPEKLKELVRFYNSL